MLVAEASEAEPVVVMEAAEAVEAEVDEPGSRSLGRSG